MLSFLCWIFCKWGKFVDKLLGEVCMKEKVLFIIIVIISKGGFLLTLVGGFFILELYIDLELVFCLDEFSIVNFEIILFLKFEDCKRSVFRDGVNS